MTVRTVLAASAVALAVAPFSGTSHAAADGCVTTFLGTDYAMGRVVDLGPPIVVDYRPVVGLAGAVAGNTVTLVLCIV